MSHLCIAIVCVLSLQHPGNLAAVEGTDKITTFAGSVKGGFSGDGGPVNEAELTMPSDLFLDEKGVLYIVGDGRIRRVGLDGIITTIAGTGERGFSGDGGLATEASFDRPVDVAVDSKGNIYIADPGNNRIRRVDVNGIITTIAGTGEGAFSGDGGPAIEAALLRPSGVAVDSDGNVYIADTGNNRVRKVNAFSGIITTIAGTDIGGFDGDGGPATEAKLDSPVGIAIDGQDIYIADQSNNRIRRVGLTGIITTIAGRGDFDFSGDGGLATDAALRPSDVAVDSKGNIYIADTGNHRIRVVDTGRIIDTLAGSEVDQPTYSGDGGPANQAKFDGPSGVAVDADGINVYIADNGNNRIRRVGPDGILALTVTSLAFDTTGVGGSSEQTLEVSNIGTGSLTLTGFTFSGAGRRDYQGQETLPTIDAGGIETVTVIFTPSREGERSAVLFVESDAGHKGIDVTGFAVEGGPEISLSASTLVLETVRIGENAVQGTITINEPGRLGSVRHSDHPGRGRCFGIRCLPHLGHDRTGGIGDHNDYIRPCLHRE